MTGGLSLSSDIHVRVDAKFTPPGDVSDSFLLSKVNFSLFAVISSSRGGRNLISLLTPNVQMWQTMMEPDSNWDWVCGGVCIN